MAKLNIPSCPEQAQLLVNTADTNLDGGTDITSEEQAGAALSLVEALHIAANRSEPFTIRFDSAVFPPQDPQSIRIHPDTPWPYPQQGLCVDGRTSGVILEWDTDTTIFKGFSLRAQSHLVGLTLLAHPGEIEVHDSVIAGSRIGTDGKRVATSPISVTQLLTVDAPGEDVPTIGPGNVIAGISGIRARSGESDIVGNYFGYDPVSDEVLGPYVAGEFWDGDPDRVRVWFRQNVFAPAEEPTLGLATTTDTEIHFEDNWFGITPWGDLFSSEEQRAFLHISTSGKVIFGPGNTVTGAQVGVFAAFSGGLLTITRNSIYGNEQGIVREAGIGGTPSWPSPPQIVAAGPSGARGTCSEDGTVELFSDAGNQGEQFLASVPCSVERGWSYARGIPRLRNLTATQTAGGQTSSFSAPATID